MANGILGKEYRKQAAEIGIRSTIRMIIELCYRFNIDANFLDLSAVPLFSMGCVYQAALAFIRYSNSDFLAVEWSRSLETLKGTLAYFAKRWRLASKSFNLVEREIIANMFWKTYTLAILKELSPTR